MSQRLKLSFRPESILLETRDQVPVAARSDASFPDERVRPEREKRNNEDRNRLRRRRLSLIPQTK